MECVSFDQVSQAFLASPPLIAQQMLDLTVKHPNFMADLWDREAWPTGNGTVMEQLVFRGEMPLIERGFESWARIANNQGCEPCEGPDCGYNWTQFGGHSFERKITELMKREFRTPTYCVAEIQTTAHFEEVFGKVIENMYRQVDFFKEMNIGVNILTMLAKKYVVDAGGAKPNFNNPYVYRNIGTARLSTLNISMLEFFYEHLRRLPDAIPYDVVDGQPLYSLVTSSQLLSRMYRDDPTLRQDVRFSGMANDLLLKYNFMSTIRGMFIAAPILYPRRFVIVDGEPVEVLPFVNGIPGEVGTYTGPSGAYEMATHEEVILHGKWPFKIWFQETLESLGGNTSFGPEPSFMENWLWINPLTENDPFRRNGFFATAIRMGVAQQFSNGIFGILVERPSISLMAMYTPNPECPVTPPECTNIVPDTVCPCPRVLQIVQNLLDPTSPTVVFATPITGVAEDPIVFTYDNGGTVTGTIVEVSDDGLIAEVVFATGVVVDNCSAIIGVACDTTGYCSSKVDLASDCRSGSTDAVKLVLDRPLRATTPGNDLLVYFGDCTTALVDIVSVDTAALEWVVRYAAGYGPTDNPDGSGGPPATNAPLTADILCDRGGIIRVCVPTATVASCPDCEAATLIPCEDEA